MDPYNSVIKRLCCIFKSKGMVNKVQSNSPYIYLLDDTCIFEPHREKTGFLHMRKQRRRSA